jgi:AcrR family transcriptional regulator
VASANVGDGVTQSRQVLAAARRNQILDAAWICFAEKGYRGTTMQEIGVAAGMSAAAIYLYFENKEAVLRASNERSQEMGRKLVADAVQSEGDPLGALQLIGRAMLSVFDDPSFDAATRVSLETFPEMIRRDDLRAALREEIDFWRTAVSEILRRAREVGELRVDVDVDDLATLLISAWMGLRQYRLVDPDHFKPEVLTETLRPFFSEGGDLSGRLNYTDGQPPRPGPPWSMPAGAPAKEGLK